MRVKRILPQRQRDAKYPLTGKNSPPKLSSLESKVLLKKSHRLEHLAEEHRKENHEIVVVMGAGFVGAVMAGIVANSVNKTTGKPGKFVIGMQHPSTRPFWKIPLLNRGIAPVEAEDP